MKYVLLFISFLLLFGCQKDELIMPDTPDSGVSLSTSTSFPDLLPLPDGFQPEGIVIGGQNKFFVGSLLNGNIYKGDLRSGEGAVFINPVDLGLTPGPAVGLTLDKRSGYLFVAGGFDLEPPFIGIVNVYDSRTGAHVQTFTYNSPAPLFINDAIVTREAVYFTDSLNPWLFKIPLDKNGRLPDTQVLMNVPLMGFSTTPFWNDGFPFPVFGNGIDATPSGDMLILGNLNRGEIYFVNPDTGESTLIDLGGERLFYADGILLDGKTLYVTQNFFNRIAVVDLNKDFTSGSVSGYIENPNLGIPSTIAELGSSLYAVNAHFDQAPPGGPAAPDLEFEVVKLEKK